MAQFRSGTIGALVLALLLAAASFWMGFHSNSIYCERLPSMTILATLSAFVMALCFRLFTRAKTSWQKLQLVAALLVAATTIFTDASFVVRYRDVCSQLEKQIRHTTSPQ